MITPERIRIARNKALQSFWGVIADEFKECPGGDFSPESTLELDEAADKAVLIWVGLNIGDAQAEAAELVQFARIFQMADPANESSYPIQDIIKMAAMFSTIHRHTNWEENGLDWESAVVEFYNKFRPLNWKELYLHHDRTYHIPKRK